MSDPDPWPSPAHWQSFHGQMLINWFVSAFADDHYLRQQLRTADLRLVAAQFCTHLLAAGVLRQLPDKDVPLPQSDNLFRPDLIYFWSHTEAVNAAPPTPGRLPSVAWPPPLSPSILQDIELHCNGSTSSFLSTGVDQKHENEKYIITELAIKVQQQKQQIQELETIIDRMKQEKERNKTLADIQSLVEGVKADFQSPTKEKVSVPPQNSGDTGGKLTQNGYHYNSTSRLESKIISPSKDQNSEGKFTSILITERVESNRESIGSPVSATSISLSVLSPEKVSVENTETACSEPTSAVTSPTNGINDQSHLTEVSIDVVHPDVIHTNESGKSSPQTNEISKTEPNHESESSTIPPPPISGLTSHTPGTALPSTGPTPPPPPPMEGIISSVPPPPPVAGTGMPSSVPPPPPPPMAGMGIPSSAPPPPPPPMAGMGIPSSVPPPPPPPMAGMGIASPAPPPPPPMAGIGISPLGPVPPPPPIPGMGLTPIGTPSSSAGGPPPPPPMTPFISGAPPPPPTPGGLNPPPSPAPFPSPPVGGWNAQKALFRKLPVNPVMPMKPLYWTRVIVPPTVTATETEGQAPQNQSVPLWGELEEVNVDNIDEFSQLFSRQVVDKKNTKKKVVKPVKTEVAKILDSKRSQNVGILAQSLHVDFSEIENAIYNFDTTTVSLEALQQIYDVRASEEELAKLRDHASAFTDQPLDKPEQFLLELADIPHFAERIACFMFQTEFSDNISGISSKLNNIKSTCQFLMSSESLKTVLGIILALGNYMNGGNMQRGQADGFGLEILSKLKDVKSKDNSMTLLHFIVITYMKKCGDVAATESKLPVPEPSDIDRASAVQFDDIESQLNNLDKELNGCQKKMETVISKSLEENVQPFKEKMEMFLKIAKKQLSEEFESCEECKRKFFATLKFYQFYPKGGVKEEEIAPKDFFPLWAPFCSDFKNLWQKEQQRIIKEKLKEAKKKQEERKEIKKGKRDAAGLKSQLRRLEERLTKT